MVLFDRPGISIRNAAFAKKQTPKKLKVLNINFQSVVNKVQEFHCLLDTENPDIVVGTESWLSPDIASRFCSQ